MGEIISSVMTPIGAAIILATIMVVLFAKSRRAALFALFTGTFMLLKAKVFQ